MLSMCATHDVRQGRISIDRWHYQTIYISKPEKCTKLSALRADLFALRAEDPSMHAVVFTHVIVSHRNIVSMLKDAGFEVCESLGSTAATARCYSRISGVGRATQRRCKSLRRDNADRLGWHHSHRRLARLPHGPCFDPGAPPPHFYGPPSASYQPTSPEHIVPTCHDASSVYIGATLRWLPQRWRCAGRIHRLGQTKDVLVKRFAFRNSEDNIIQLHAAIKAGTIQSSTVTSRPAECASSTAELASCGGRRVKREKPNTPTQPAQDSSGTHSPARSGLGGCVASLRYTLSRSGTVSGVSTYTPRYRTVSCPRIMSLGASELGILLYDDASRVPPR